VTLTNAHCLHVNARRGLGMAIMDRKIFHSSLAQQLHQQMGSGRQQPMARLEEPPHPFENEEDDEETQGEDSEDEERPDQPSHSVLPFKHICIKQGRGVCAQCSRVTRSTEAGIRVRGKRCETYCPECGVWLCVLRRNCFHEFHENLARRRGRRH